MFSDPEALAVIIGIAAATALVTWLFARYVGLRIARDRKELAMTCSIFLVPACTLIYGIVIYRIDSARYPTNDMPPMALMGYMMMSIMMFAVTIPITALVIRRKTGA